MLLLAPHTLAIVSALKKKNLEATRAPGAGTHEIAGMTVGIVGVGAIGSRVARIARRGFGMRGLGNQRSLERLPPEGPPAGAMLDVYEHSRLEAGPPLLSLDNAILTPHLSGMTVESRSRMGVAAAEEMLRMLAGEAPRHFVNPQAKAARIER